MHTKKKQHRALGLFSGGLDSILASKLIQSQNIVIEGICFTSPFFSADQAKRSADQLHIPLRIVDFTSAQFALVRNPPHGYGRNLNPCIDCHALMLRKAGMIMKKENFDFIFSGEVLGERSMSQNARTIHLVAQESGFERFILRPLSAQLLPITIPEELGIVDRTRLLGISGQSRKIQFQLARTYNISSPPTPSGGCLLTEKEFCKKLKHLMETTDAPKKNDLRLLRYGRHFHIQNGVKLILGKNQRENEFLRSVPLRNKITISAEHIPGPRAIFTDNVSRSIQEKAAELVVAYSDAGENKKVSVFISERGKTSIVSLRVSEKTRKKILFERIG